MASTTLQNPETFERRYYEAIRRERLSPALGRAALGLIEREELEARRREEVSSGLAEGISGAVSTEWPCEFHDGKLVASDKEPIENMLQKAGEVVAKQAETDPFYASFLPQRTAHELAELHEQEAMCSGLAESNIFFVRLD